MSQDCRPYTREDAAGKKFCPLMRAAIVAAAVPLMDSRKFTQEEHDALNAAYRCTGSLCMWWGWMDSEKDFGRCAAPGCAA